MRLTLTEWNKLMDDKQIQDISNELPDGFTVIHQIMRAKVIYQGKKWLANGWNPPGSDAYVELKEVK